MQLSRNVVRSRVEPISSVMNVHTICKRTKHLKMVEMPLKARVILRGMTNNPHFPDAGPLLTLLEEKRAAMEKANMACLLDGGRIPTHTRKVCRRELEHVLDMLVGYVKATSKFDITVALSSGFQLRKPPLLLHKPSKPEDLRVQRTEFEGHLVLRWEPIHGARLYLIYMNKLGAEDSSAWEQVAITSRARFDAEGLESGKHHWFRVVALRAAGLSPISQVVGCMAG